MDHGHHPASATAVKGFLRLSACASIAFLFLLRHQLLATQQHPTPTHVVVTNHDHHHPASQKHDDAHSFWDEVSALNDHDDVMMTSRSLAEEDNEDDQDEEETVEGPTHNATTTPLHSAGLPPAALQQWCPFAQCHVTNLCHPCRRRYLNVIATGRSGSTTLKEMLNALPGIRLSGENNGFLGHWMQAMEATTRDARWKKANKQKSAAWFHHAAPKQAWACVTQQAVETLVPPPPPPKNQRRRKMVAAADDDDDRETIVGFKTIRFPLAQGETTAEELKRAAQFLTQQAFPCARIVINYRSNAAEQARSMKRSWTGRNSSLAALQGEAQANTRVLQELARQLGPQRAFVLDSAEWTRNVTQLNELVSWLGFDDACHFDELFQFNTEKSYKAGSVTSRPPPPQCIKLPFS